MTENRLSRKAIYEGKTLDVYVDEVRLPDGKTSQREVIEHRGSVALVAVQDGNLYLARQFRYVTGETLLELPAGTLDPGEDPEQAARRELIEEIGYAAGSLTFLFQGYVSPGYTNEMQWCYLAQGLTPAHAEHDADEFIDVVTMPLAEAVEKVAQGAFRDSKTVAGILAAARKLGVG